MKIAQVLAVKGTENVVGLFFLIRYVTKGASISRELHAWKESSWRVSTYYPVCASDAHYRSMRPAFNHLHHLPISEKGEDSLLNDILEDKVLVIVAELNDICLQKVVQGKLPLVQRLCQLCIVINLLLGDIRVQDLLIDAVTEGGGDTTLSILNQKGLVVLGKEPLPDKNALIDKGFLLIDSNLAVDYIHLIVLLP